jgi:hypothetical protein
MSELAAEWGRWGLDERGVCQFMAHTAPWVYGEAAPVIHGESAPGLYGQSAPAEGVVG